MRTSKIASDAEYQMDEKFQNLLIFRIFRVLKFGKFVNFKIWKIEKKINFTIWKINILQFKKI